MRVLIFIAVFLILCMPLFGQEQGWEPEPYLYNWPCEGVVLLVPSDQVYTQATPFGVQYLVFIPENTVTAANQGFSWWTEKEIIEDTHNRFARDDAF